MFEVPKQVYTAEFKLAAVQRVKEGEGMGAVAREIGISKQTRRNWVKAEASGKLNGAGANEAYLSYANLCGPLGSGGFAWPPLNAPRTRSSPRF